MEYLLEFTKIIRSLYFFDEAYAKLDSVFSSMEKRKNKENFNATLKYNYFEVNNMNFNGQLPYFYFKQVRLVYLGF